MKTGRFLGLPYDFRKPTLDRVKRRAWNPDDRHLFVPKAFGWGYDINFHELARRLHLVR